MGQLSQGMGLSGNTVHVTAPLFVGVLFRKILVTVDGFGFGTLTGESCLKNVHCHTDGASWDAILVTVVDFGALMWKKCAQSHSFGLGRVGGGGYHCRGGGRGIIDGAASPRRRPPPPPMVCPPPQARPLVPANSHTSSA